MLLPLPETPEIDINFPKGNWTLMLFKLLPFAPFNCITGESLFLLLPALALPRVEAISFLATFFIGTIISMGTYTYCIGAGAAALEKNNPKFVSYISRGSSAVALGFGVLFVVSAIFGLDLI